MDKFINNLTPDEERFFELNANNLFKPTIKTNINRGKGSTISPDVLLSLNQSEKYTTVPTPKTIFGYLDSDSKDVKEIIDLLNQTTDFIHRNHLLTLKNIYSARQYNISLYTPYDATEFDKYRIEAGAQSQRCLRCRSLNTIPITRQKRSADEPSETYYNCQDCNCEFVPKVHI